MAFIRNIVRYCTPHSCTWYPKLFLMIAVILIVSRFVYKQVFTVDTAIVDLPKMEIAQQEDSNHPHTSSSTPGTPAKNEIKEQILKLNPMSDQKFFRNVTATVNKNCQFTLSNPYVYFNKEPCCEYGRDKSLEELCGQVNETTLGNKTHLGDLCTCIDFMACKMVIVTGISSNHYSEAQDGIASAQIFHPNTTIIVLNLGLKDEEVRQLNSLHNVRVVRYPFEKYPPHVKILTNFAWKVLAIYNALHEYEIVFWMDASVRIIAPLTDKLLQDLQVFPFRAEMLKYFYDAAYTYDSTYERFGVTRREMSRKSQVQGGFHLSRNCSFLHHYLYNDYVQCVLDKDCIHPPNSTVICPKTVAFPPDGGPYPEEIPNIGCFRYDQSILTILVYRNFNITEDPPCLASISYTLVVYRHPSYCFITEHGLIYYFISLFSWLASILSL